MHIHVYIYIFNFTVYTYIYIYIYIYISFVFPSRVHVDPPFEQAGAVSVSFKSFWGPLRVNLDPSNWTLWPMSIWFHKCGCSEWSIFVCARFPKQTTPRASNFLSGRQTSSLGGKLPLWAANFPQGGKLPLWTAKVGELITTYKFKPGTYKLLEGLTWLISHL